MNAPAEREFASMRRALMAADRAERRGYLREADTLGAMAANCLEVGLALERTPAYELPRVEPKPYCWHCSGSGWETCGYGFIRCSRCNHVS